MLLALSHHRNRVILALSLWVCLGLIYEISQGADPKEAPRVQQIEGTLHNLSIEGPGVVHSTEMEEICRFCHVSHLGSPVGLMFNKPDTQSIFVPYDSPTLDATPSSPTSISRLCLTCHDGSIAVGDLLSEQVAFPVGHEFLQQNTGSLDPMLRDDHPISIIYDANLVLADPELANPATLPTDLLLENGNTLQCSSCHDAHDNTLGTFMRRPWEDGNLCEQCHVRDGWSISSHQVASRTHPVGTVTGCVSCHKVHFGTLDTPLLAGAAEETGCFECHDADGPSVDVQSDFAKVFTHPVQLTAGVHNGNEDPTTMPPHVECTDCHNPHAVTSGGDPMGTMAQLPGIDKFGFEVKPATEPQQVCYRCHGLAAEASETVPRQVSGVSIREQFADTAASVHPVDRDAVGTSPSLLPGWSSVSRITCTDCHGGAEGTAAMARPHGSQIQHILRNNYRTDSGTGSINGDAALCLRCHDINVLTGGSTNFDKHDKHFNEGILCVSCHSPHGVPGSTTNHAHLINFDLRVVFPSKKGKLEYVSEGLARGNCSLLCHGKDHDQKGY